MRSETRCHLDSALAVLDSVDWQSLQRGRLGSVLCVVVQWLLLLQLPQRPVVMLSLK